MKFTRKLALQAVAVAAVAGSTLAVVGSIGAHAAVAGQSPTIVDPQNNTLNFGGSLTSFSFKFATPAKCTSDSNNGYFVYSYIVPAATSPLSLTFNSNGPMQPGSFPLFRDSGQAYIAKATAIGTGQIQDFPGWNFNFAKFNLGGTGGKGNLAAGNYNIGVACSKAGVTDNVFNALITFSASGCDPAGEVWNVTGQPNGNPTPHVASAPRNLSAVPGGLLSFAVNVSWAPPADTGCGALHYVLMRGTAAGSETPLATVNGTSFTDGGHTLDIATTFFYKVVAVNSSGTSVASNEAHSKAEPWNLIPL